MPRPISNTMPLTPRQQRFVEEYLCDLNGKQAAIRAGYSPKTAEVQAAQTLRIPKVQAALSAALARRSQRTAITQDTVLRELAVLAQSDIRDYVIDDQGNVQLREGAPEGAMRAISSLKKRIVHTENALIYETTLTLWNKPASVRMAGEHVGLFKGREQPPPDIHVHMDTARERLSDRLDHLATRHAEDATNGQ
jgi:phage terminase small subunit